MKIFSNTNVGLARKNNQDAFAVEIKSDQCAWSLVCDGMGGANGGNVASKIAVDTIEEILKENYKEELSAQELSEISLYSIKCANDEVFATAKDDKELSGMGTTVVLALLNNNNLCISHVGDSRIYLYSYAQVKQVTKDHSYVQDLMDNGSLTEQEAKVHPLRNIITRSVGVHDKVEIDTQILQVNEKDIIVLCSDGLSNYISTKQLEEFIENTEIEKLCDKLIEFALECGGADNVTVSVILV